MCYNKKEDRFRRLQMNTVIKAYTLSECMEVMAQYAQA